MNQSFRRQLVICEALVVFAVARILPASATTCMVTNGNDSGAGSLRQCILNTNDNNAADTITFGGDITVALTSVLPAVDDATYSTTINGWGNNVVIDGSACAGCAYGIQLSNPGGHAVRYLDIRGFDTGTCAPDCSWFSLTGTAGIKVYSNNVTIDHNNIGANGANCNGITSSSDNLSIHDNIISGNVHEGIYLCASDFWTIYNNWIGTDALLNVVPNHGHGIALDYATFAGDYGSNNNSIHDNIIANNLGDGIIMYDDTSEYNNVYSNKFYNNSGPAIVLSGGANQSISPPTITGVSWNGTNYTVTGVAPANSTVHLFQANSGWMPVAAADGTGAGEATDYFGSVVADGGGNFSLGGINMTRGGDLITGTATNGSGSTSQFANNFLVRSLTDITTAMYDTSDSVPDIDISFYWNLYSCFVSSTIATPTDEYSISTAPGGSNIVGWTAINPNGTFAATYLSNMTPGGTYFCNFRRAGVVRSSDGFMLENTLPTITDNQGGDNTWRNTGGTAYDVDFSDNGFLDFAQYIVYSSPGMGGTLIKNWTPIFSGLNSPSYAANWGVDFASLQEGINYVSVRARDFATNTSNITADAFYVLKDTLTPVQSVWAPAAGTFLTVPSVTITMSTNETASCRWALTDLAFGSMTNGCAGAGSTNHSCSVTGLARGANTISIACADTTVPNLDTAVSNTDHLYYYYTEHGVIVDNE